MVAFRREDTSDRRVKENPHNKTITTPHAGLQKAVRGKEIDSANEQLGCSPEHALKRMRTRLKTKRTESKTSNFLVRSWTCGGVHGQDQEGHTHTRHSHGRAKCPEEALSTSRTWRGRGSSRAELDRECHAQHVEKKRSSRANGRQKSRDNGMQKSRANGRRKNRANGRRKNRANSRQKSRANSTLKSRANSTQKSRAIAGERAEPTAGRTSCGREHGPDHRGDGTDGCAKRRRVASDTKGDCVTSPTSSTSLDQAKPTWPCATWQFIMALARRGDSVFAVVCERTRDGDELFHETRMVL